jgi:GNAT superfamily N-acetyltransferase
LAPSALVVDFRPVTDFKRKHLKYFDSGNAEMNRYLHHDLARKNHKLQLSPCMVVVARGSDDPILGYVTVSNSSVEKGNPPPPPYAQFPNYPVPVTLIGRLAVAVDHQGAGIGRRILMHVFFQHARSVRELGTGSVGVVADAIDDKAVRFYQKNDFRLLPDQPSFPKRMFIANATILSAIDD